MSQFGVLLALVFSLIIAVLAIANNQPVVINYLYGSTEVSAVVIILGAAVLGALVIFILSIFGHVKKSLQLRNMRNELKSLQEKVQSLQNERDILLANVGRLEEALANAERKTAGVQEDEDFLEEPTLCYEPEENGDKNATD